MIPVLRCGGCGALHLPPALGCARCGTETLAPEDAGPRGTVHASTTIRVPITVPGEEDAPAPVAVVRLECGLLMPARLDPACADSRPAIGTRVRLEQHGGTWFAFAVAGEAGGCGPGAGPA